jgi:hypothetical protein
MIYFFMLTEGANHLIGTMGLSDQAKDPSTLNVVCFSGSPRPAPAGRSGRAHRLCYRPELPAVSPVRENARLGI